MFVYIYIYISEARPVGPRNFFEDMGKGHLEGGHLSIIHPEAIESRRKEMTDVASKLAENDIPVRYVGSHDGGLFAYKSQLAPNGQLDFVQDRHVLPCPKFIMHACRKY